MRAFASRLPMLVAFWTSLLLAVAPPASAAEGKSFRVAWTIYVGWMPWDYANRSGILKRWADRYGITIDLVEAPDYAKSIEQYAHGRYDACLMTNLDVLGAPAAAGLDSTVLIVGSFSNGNDGVLVKGKGKKLADLIGQPVNLVQYSVSHYLLARSLEISGHSEKEVRLVDTSDSDIVARFPQPGVVAAVTWKPHIEQMTALTEATVVFDSSRIPGEIMDLLVVNTSVLRANPELGKALVGAWYETMAIMSGHDAKATAALTSMAKASDLDLKGFRSQLATTKMFYLPAEAYGFMSGSSVARTMDLARTFAYSHNLLGPGAKNVNSVGIEFPRAAPLGTPQSIRIRFDATFTKAAADGKL